MNKPPTAVVQTIRDALEARGRDIELALRYYSPNAKYSRPASIDAALAWLDTLSDAQPFAVEVQPPQHVREAVFLALEGEFSDDELTFVVYNDAARDEWLDTLSDAQPVAAVPLVINEYQVQGGGPYDAVNIRLCRRRQIEGDDKWAIYRNGSVLNRDGEWEYEPLPSSRDDEFIARCRFDTPEEALAVLATLAPAAGQGDG